MKFTKSGFGKLASIFGMFAIVVASFAFALSSAKAAEYDYAWAGQSDWPTISQGGSATVTLSLKNTGTAAWTNSGSNPMHLAAINPQDRNCGFFKSGEWLTANRAASLNESSVAPGEIGTFTFTVVGNPAPGTYPEYFAPVIENLTWMDNFSATPHGKYGIYWNITVTPGAGTSGYNAELISKSTDPTIAAGDSATLTVTVKNTGTATWSNTGANPMHLGTWNPQDRSSDFYDATWLSTNRPTGLTEASVAPGAQGTFTFTVKVPSSKANGTYTETFNLVSENLGWLNLPISFPITVSGTSTGDVTVSLASDTPVGQTLPQGATGVSMAKFKFIGTGTISSLKVHRFGVGSTDAFENVYLYEGDKRLTNGRSVSSSTHMVEFNNLNYSVSGTKYLTIVADLVDGKQGQHGFEILSASDVSLSSVSGSFPIKGQLFAIGDEHSSEVTISNRPDPANPNVGAAAELAKFKIENGANDTKLYRISLVQTGDINNSDLTNLELWSDNDSKKIAEVDELDGDKIIFVLDTPYSMPDGSTRLFTVKGTTAGRSGRTVQMYVEYTADMLIIDQQYGYGAMVQNDYDGTGGQYSEVTLQGGDITISYSGPATGDITKNGQDQKMLNFAISSASRQVEIKKLEFQLEGNADDLKTGSTYYFSDIKVRETDSAYTASTQSTGTTLMGPKSLSSASCASDQSCTVTFNDSFYVDSGDTRYLQLTWDVSNEAYPVDREYKATLLALTSTSMRYTDTGQYVPLTDIVPSGQHAGNWMTVKESTLSVNLDGAVSSQTVVKNQKDVKAVAYKFSTGNDAVTVNSLKLYGYLDDAADGTGTWTGTDTTSHNTLLKDYVQNVRMVKGGTVLATGKTLTSGAKNVNTDGTVTFSGLNWKINGNTTEVVEIWFDVSSSAFNSADKEIVAFKINSTTTDIDAVNNDGDTVNAAGGTINGAPTVAITIDQTGTLDVELDAGTPSADLLVATGSDNTTKLTVAKFKLKTEREAFKVEKLGLLIDPNGANNQIAVKDVYIAYDGKEKLANNFDGLAGGTGQAKFENITDLTVPKDGGMIVEVKVVLKKIYPTDTTEDSYSNKQVIAKIDDNIMLRGVGAASGEVKTQYKTHLAGVEASGNQFDIHRSKPTIQQVALSTSGDFEAGSYIQKTVYKFTVSADNAGDVELGRVCFTTTTSGFVAGDYNNWKLYQDGNATAISNSQNGFSPCLTVNAADRKISAGTTKTYLVKVDISNNNDGDSLSLRIADPVAAHADRTTLGAAGAGNLIWSDLSDYGRPSIDDGTAADYINDHLVDFMPLDSTSWTNNS